MEEGFSWGGLIFHPLQQLLAKFGIDPVAGVDALIVSTLLIVFAFFAGRRFRGRSDVEPDAREYECDSCGKPSVFGAEELITYI